MSKTVIIIVVLAVVIGVLFSITNGQIGNLIPSLGKREPQQVTLNYWGTLDDEVVLKPLFEAYQQAHPNIKIVYSKQSLTNYRTRIQTQLRAGQGPDLFAIHNSWVPMFVSDISPLTSKDLSIDDYGKTFYPVVKSSFIFNNKVYGFPSEIDGLVLFYNQDLLNFANINPPTNWQELIVAAKSVTVAPEKSPIQTAGVAMGSINNVDYWPEIVGTLFYQQPDGNILTPENKDGQEVLPFYGKFVTDPQYKTWDSILPPSTQMFINGRLAFFIAPSKVASQIIQANPNLKFKTTNLPQLPGKEVSWATFWGNTVSARSKNSIEAWNLVRYLSSEQSVKFLNQQRIQNKLQPLVYPRSELASEQVNDPIYGSVVKQGNYYVSWYLNSQTFDDGINDHMIKVFEKAMKNYLQEGGKPDAVLQDASLEIKQVLGEYRL